MTCPVESKPTNPKDRLGSARVPLDLVPFTAILEEAIAFAEGAIKYGPYNWRTAGVRVSIYIGAALRHIAKYYFAGQDCDTKTRVKHLASARACLGIILDAEAVGKLTDDRPPPVPEIDAMIERLEGVFAHLREIFSAKT